MTGGFPVVPFNSSQKPFVAFGKVPKTAVDPKGQRTFINSAWKHEAVVKQRQVNREWSSKQSLGERSEWNHVATACYCHENLDCRRSA